MGRSTRALAALAWGFAAVGLAGSLAAVGWYSGAFQSSSRLPVCRTLGFSCAQGRIPSGSLPSALGGKPTRSTRDPSRPAVALPVTVTPSSAVPAARSLSAPQGPARPVPAVFTSPQPARPRANPGGPHHGRPPHHGQPAGVPSSQHGQSHGATTPHRGRPSTSPTGVVVAFVRPESGSYGTGHGPVASPSGGAQPLLAPAVAAPTSGPGEGAARGNAPAQAGPLVRAVVRRDGLPVARPGRAADSPARRGHSSEGPGHITVAEGATRNASRAS